MRYQNDEMLNKQLDIIEGTEKAYILEIVVGRGNNSANPGVRPVLLETMEFLEKECHCRVIV